MTDYTPDEEQLLQHYRELSETVSGDASVGEQNAEIARRTIAKIKADALREAADDLAVKLQTFLGGREKLFIEVDRLRERADRIEGAINDD